MNNKKHNKGFTMAEMLIVVAILIALMGVVFIAVQNHQRSMTRLEFDGLAKEIFIAAQNHLTSAEGQGYLQNTDFGQKGTLAKDPTDDVWVAEKTSSSADSILELMLPFGALDETVRAGGTYLIRYQPSSGTVLDVFYSLPGRSSLLTISGKELTINDYAALMGTSPNYRENGERNRERYSGGVIGWYGSVEPLPIGERIKEPEIIIHNEEALWVEVKDNNTGSGSLKLIVTGATSGAKKAFDLRGSGDTRVKNTSDLRVILDDITTSGMHFAELTADSGTFICGEDLIVEAVAFDNTKLTNIAYSGRKTTNSLFADIEHRTVTEGSETKTEHVAMIEYFRHFENLDKTVSSFDGTIQKTGDTSNIITVSKAEQIKDLLWTGTENTDTGVRPFIENIKSFSGSSTVSIYKAKPSTSVATDDTLFPVSPTFKLNYDGQNHSVSNVKVNHSGDAGLFGTVNQSGSEIKNLELIDFDITGTTSAGALVGTATGSTITNVVAYHTAKDNAYATPTVKASGGDAGGLIGKADNSTVTKSAAALVVNATANAGGLIGSTTGGTVTACYSGGHTNSGLPSGAAQKYDDAHKDVFPVRYYDKDNIALYNVTATGTSSVAGGLIGSAGSTTISNSYSTCSASGTTAGGFVGTSTGKITNCYCTGLVPHNESETVGAFAASLSGTVSDISDCSYFEIINEVQNKDASNNPSSGYHYLTPLPKTDSDEGTRTGITALDLNASIYESFSPRTADAKPYDTTLKTYYQNKYNFKSIANLVSSGVLSTDFVSTHYGDWPAPEEFVFN